MYKYLKYKNKYLHLKKIIGGNSFITETFDPDDPDDFYTERQLIFLNNILQKPEFHHFAFVKIEPTRVISNKLNNECRMDKDSFEICFPKETTDSFIKISLTKLIIWLYNNVWRHYWTHGDLTTNNIIFDDITKEFVVIDWKDRLSPEINPRKHVLLFILDLYDLLDSFSKKFIDIINVPGIIKIGLHIKTYETEIVDSDNEKIINDIIYANDKYINNFLYDIQILTGIDFHSFITELLSY